LASEASVFFFWRARRRPPAVGAQRRKFFREFAEPVMLVHIFTLKFHAATERFDDEEFQEFIKDKGVLSVREHFFLNQTVPYLVLIVTYLPGADTQPSQKKKEKWRESLTNEQIPMFDALRKWRAERAKQDGCPPYIICTNQELADMVAGRPDSLAGLLKIRGFGKAKLEKYGKEILAVLSRQPEDQPEPSPHQQVMFQDSSHQAGQKKGAREDA
jgi:ATP-dependent DNA helicase RecQ